MGICGYDDIAKSIYMNLFNESSFARQENALKDYHRIIMLLSAKP